MGHLPHQWEKLPHQWSELAHQKLCWTFTNLSFINIIQQQTINYYPAYWWYVTLMCADWHLSLRFGKSYYYLNLINYSHGRQSVTDRGLMYMYQVSFGGHHLQALSPLTLPQSWLMIPSRWTRPIITTFDVPFVSDIAVNIQQMCVKSFTSVPYPESESELGSNLLVLKLNNGCFKTHSERFQNLQNQLRPDPTGRDYSAPQTL